VKKNTRWGDRRVRGQCALYTKSATEEIEWGIDLVWHGHTRMAPPGPIIVAVSNRDKQQYLPVLHS
jgi:hypothetical protein